MNSREFKERYLFDPQQDLIAEGTYSRVFHAMDKLLQRDICIKLFRKELISDSPLIRELNRAGVFFHPNLCAFYDLVEIEETNVLGESEVQPLGIIEYMNGGTITDFIRKHKDEVQTKKLIKDVIRGLSYLHSVDKPHLDLKPGNLLIKLSDKGPVAKIADFLNSENLHTRAIPIALHPQQICYKAPEHFEAGYGERNFRADIWSLGMIVYEIAAGENLLWEESDTIDKTIRNICYKDYWSKVYALPEPYATFVKKCLVRNATEREVSLEELTLILDGFRAEETKVIPTLVTPAAAPIENMVATVAAPIPVAIIVPAVEKAPNPQPPPTPVQPEKPRAKQSSLRASLSLPIIIACFLILAGMAAYVRKMTIDDRNIKLATKTKPVANTADNAPIAALQKKSGTPVVVHDTIKVIQIQQIALASAFTPPARAANIPQGTQVNSNDVKVHAMPSLPSYDFLYTAKPYYFDLKTPLMADEEFDLYSENAAITALGKNTFYVKPLQPGPMDVMVLDKTSHAKIAEKVYSIREKPMPVATIGDDITGGFVSPKMLLAKLTMQARSENGIYKIKSFHMTCKSGACNINDASDNGKFNESMIRFLRNVRSGEELFFDNIMAEDESGQIIKLDPFQITTY